MLDTQRLDIALNSDRQYLPPGSELLESDDIPVVDTPRRERTRILSSATHLAITGLHQQ